MPAWPTFEDILRAYKSCRLHKPANRSQTNFEKRLGENILKLHNEIHSQKYKPKPANVFIVVEPKPREIFASDFRDRVVHHLVINQLEPKWERKFIYSSFACRKGKGVHAAIKYLQKKARSLCRGGNRDVYALQIDISSFFVTINRQILSQLLIQKETNQMLIYLVQTIYLHDARMGAVRLSDKNSFKLIPKGKSWFDQSPELGLPIGNLTSQFGANAYLNGLDHFIVRNLKPETYLRYMDDLTILSFSAEKLQNMVVPIDEWLFNNRKQKLNPTKTKISNLKEGISYLGYYFKQTNSPAQPLEAFVEPKKKWKLVQSLKLLEHTNVPIKTTSHFLGSNIPNKIIQKILAQINSRLGAIVHASSYTHRKNALLKLMKNIRVRTLYEIKKGYRALRLKQSR